MVIYLCYSYHPNTTAVYLERALRRDHEVYYIGPGYGSKPGYASNIDLRELVAQGLPRPDVVLFSEPGVRFFPRGIEEMECPTACYLIDVHQSLQVRELYVPFFDFVFVAQRDFVGHFQKRTTAPVNWLPLACDPEVHCTRQDLQVLEQEQAVAEQASPAMGGEVGAAKFDVGFVGHGNSGTRLRRLQQLEGEFSMNNWSRTYPKEEIAEVYSRSRIVFNTSVNGDLNMRVFEAMASGALLLTDTIGNGMSDIFEDSVHLALYNSDDEMMAQARKFLGDEAMRKRVASTGRAEVLARHTYSHRCAQVLSTIFGPEADGKSPRASVVSRRAPLRRASAGAVRIAYAQVYAMQRQVDPILDELEASWRHPRSRARLLASAARALSRRINSFALLSLGARRQARTRSQKLAQAAGEAGNVVNEVTGGTAGIILSEDVREKD